MMKPGYWMLDEVEGMEGKQRLELVAIAPLDAPDEFGQAFALTWKVVPDGRQFSEKRHKLVECDCDFCCEEVVGVEPRKSVAQM